MIDFRAIRRSRSGRSLALAASLMLSVAAVVIPTGPAAAACVQAGNVVTCSGATSTGFGTGTENNLTVTVQPNASIALGTFQDAINVGNGNTVLNSGSINTGIGGLGIAGLANNTFTNAGTITVGPNSMAGAMDVSGSNNTLTNSGTINSTVGAIAILLSGSNNTAINSGTITLAGAGSLGIEAFASSAIQNSGSITVGSSTVSNGAGVLLTNNNTLTNTGTITIAGSNGIGVLITGVGNIITNSGTINGGSNGYALATNGGGPTTGNIINNIGTLDGRLVLAGSNNAVTNAGLITITDPATPLAVGNFGINGTFTQTAQGTLALRVDNTGANDGLFADNVHLNGTLRAVLQPGLYQSSTTYKGVVIGGTSLAGQFSSVTSSSAFFNAVATYNPLSVDLTLTRYAFGAVPGETANQRSVGNAVEAGYSTALTGAAATFYTRLLQAPSVRVLDQLSGEGTSGTQNTAFAAGSLFGQTMDDQMTAWRTGNRSATTGGLALGYAEERPNGVASAFNAVKAPAMAQPPWHAWAAGFGAGQSLSGDAATGSADFSDRVAGGAMGVDHLLNPDLLVGVSAGGSSSTFSVDVRGTSGNLEGAHVGAYAMQRFGASYLSAQLAYGHFDNTTTRLISGIGPDETAKGSFGSDQLGGRLEVGHTYAFSSVSATPFAAIQAAKLWQPAYTETSTAGGAPGVLALSYAARDVSSTPIFLGAKFDGRFDFGNGMLWTPFVNAAWVHEFEPTRAVTASLTTFALPNFTVEGARAAADAAQVQLGSRLVLNRWWELSGRVTGEFSAAGQSYAGIGSLRASW
jgi:uncharacterized protein with beta-barrel porin domain